MSKERVVGTEWETRVTNDLREDFPGVHRLPFSSPHGDLGGVLPGLVIECKAWKRFDPATWMKQAKASAARISPTAIAAVIAKRINHPVGKAYVIMELDDWKTMVRQLSHMLPYNPADFRVDL